MTLLAAGVEVIKAIAWPAAILIAALVFRRQLSQLLPRVTEVGPGGVKIGPAEQTAVDLSPESIERAALPATRTSELVLLPVPGEPLSFFEQTIRDDLAKLAPTDVTNREKLLIRGLAATQMELAFERIYAIIFGSQIRLLKEANAAKRLPAETAFKIYDEARTAFSELHSSRPYELWRDFLVDSGLINIESGSSAIVPTPACPEFLAYIARRQMPENKFG